MRKETDVMFLATIAIISFLVVLIKIYLKLSIGRCVSPACLVGKTVLITGANSGIGYQTALILAGRGCRLLIADKDNCDQTRINIINETGNTNIVIKQFDLASLKSIRHLAKEISKSESRLDILINNAGSAGLQNFYTEDGLHIGMQVNHFGPFLLTHLLIKLMKKSESARIVFVSSFSAYIAYLKPENINCSLNGSSNVFSNIFNYSNSKLCTIITANLFAKKLKETRIIVNSVHPGVVITPLVDKILKMTGQSKWIYNLYSYAARQFTKTPFEGAQTTVHVALAKELEKVSGKFFIDCKPVKMPYFARDNRLAKQIWDASEGYVKLLPEERL